MRRKQIDLDRLEELVYADHVAGCNQCECDITASYEAGFVFWSAHLLLNGGAASDELDKLYRKLKPSKQLLDRECDQFVKDVPYTECTECGSVNWNTDIGTEVHCWQCAKQYKSK